MGRPCGVLVEDRQDLLEVIAEDRHVEADEIVRVVDLVDDPGYEKTQEASFSLWISSCSISRCFVRSVIRMMAMLQLPPPAWTG